MVRLSMRGRFYCVSDILFTCLLRRSLTRRVAPVRDDRANKHATRFTLRATRCTLTCTPHTLKKYYFISVRFLFHYYICAPESYENNAYAEYNFNHTLFQSHLLKNLEKTSFILSASNCCWILFLVGYHAFGCTGFVFTYPVLF